MLKGRGSVQSCEPHFGQATEASSAPSPEPNSSTSLSARKRDWHLRQSTSGSLKVASCPEYFQTRRLRMIEESMPSMSSRS